MLRKKETEDRIIFNSSESNLKHVKDLNNCHDDLVNLSRTLGVCAVNFDQFGFFSCLAIKEQADEKKESCKMILNKIKF